MTESDAACPICLDRPMQNPSLLDRCFHSFCFDCIVAWVKTTPSCPLCKREFEHIVHDILTEDIFMCTPLIKIVGVDAAYKAKPRHPASRDARAPVWGSTSTWQQMQRATSATNNADSVATTATRGHSKALSGLSATDESMRFANRKLVYTEQRKVRPLEFAGESLRKSSVSASLTRVRQLDDVARRLGEPAVWARLAPFAERELRAITSVDDVDVLLHVVKTLVQKHNVRQTRDAQVYLASMLPSSAAEILCSELIAYAASTFDMATYDRLVLYEESATPSSRVAMRDAAVESESAALRPRLLPPIVPVPAPTTTGARAADVLTQRSVFCQCAAADARDCVACCEVAFLQATIASLDAQIAAERQAIEAMRKE
jgi:hypothetical protein